MAVLEPTAVPPAKGTLTGWHALMWFIGFFGFMFVVNGIFLWTAIRTFPGEDVDKSYLAGIDYNSELARRTYQSEQGWRAEIGLEDAQLRVLLLSGAETPLAAQDVSVMFRHPADRNLDRVVELTPIGGGEYAGSVADFEAGTWTARVTADIDTGKEGFEFEAWKKLELP